MKREQLFNQPRIRSPFGLEAMRPLYPRRLGAVLAQAASFLWEGPGELPLSLRLEWRFVAIRWAGIVFLAPTLPFFSLPANRLIGAYAVLLLATVYNLVLQLLLVKRKALLAKGYVTTVCDGFSNIAMVTVAGGFDTPFYLIFYTVTVATAMRYGYGPVLAVATLYVSSDLLDSLIKTQQVSATFIFRSVFLLLTAVLAAYLHEQAQKAEALLEERLHQANALNKELEAFSYSVSHDLRAPLRSIDGFSQALLEDYEEKLDDEGQDYLRRVRAASQRMAQLIDDLLKLSRVTRSDLRRESVNLSALAAQVVNDLRQAEPDRTVNFVMAYHVVANGDPQLLHLVLENLLGNAWKFTRRRTQARIEFGVRQQDNRPVYFVRDNGVGFDMAYVDKLFRPFQRLHSVDEFDGNGIGLATTQRIIFRHGGRVWAESQLGRGTTFYFTL